MEEVDNKNLKKKERKIGTYTFGAMLIFIGISVIIMTFTKLEIIKYVLALWPIFLIGLGIEILYLNSKSDTRVKIDFWSIVLMSIVLFFTGIFSLGNYFINKVLYDNEVKQILANEFTQESFFDIKNDEKIELNIKEKDRANIVFKKLENGTKSGYILVNFDYIVDDNTSWIEIVNFNNKKFDEEIVNYKEGILNLKSLPKYIEKANITIYSDSIDNINYDGNITEE